MRLPLIRFGLRTTLHLAAGLGGGGRSAQDNEASEDIPSPWLDRFKAPAENHFSLWRRRFSRALAQLSSSDGYFYAHQTQPHIPLERLPLLSIERFGSLGYPLSESVAQQLVESNVTVPSPFGWGNQTLVDTKVRHCWELQPHQIKLLNPETWAGQLRSIVDKAASELLGVASMTAVEAQLYKVLLYPPRGMFQPHRDSEKEPGMFATLAVQLPSHFEGGDMMFSPPSTSSFYNNGGKETVRLDKGSATSLSWTAWYADCLHEIRPVTRGYRLVMVYNLVQREPPEPPTWKISRYAHARLQLLVREWKQLVQNRIQEEGLSCGGMQNFGWESFSNKSNDFINDMCYVHKLDHLYTLPNQGVTQFYQETSYGTQCFLDKFQTLRVNDNNDGNTSHTTTLLKGRDKTLVRTLQTMPLDITVVVQDFCSLYAEDIPNHEEGQYLTTWNIHTIGEQPQEFLWWNILPPLDDYGIIGDPQHPHFRLVHLNQTMWSHPSMHRIDSGWQCWEDSLLETYQTLHVPSIEYIGNSAQFGEQHYRVVFLILRPRIDKNDDIP